jgi:heptosyltransferase I
MNDPQPTVPAAIGPDLCLLRLSALGDVSHVVAVAQRLQRDLPGVRLTWIIGKLEHRLLEGLPGVEFIVVDKKSLWPSLKSLRRQLRGRCFDALLHMQISLRANLVASCVRARRRIGLDPARSKDLHGLFVRERIRPAPPGGEHVVSALMAFTEKLGLAPAVPAWLMPIPAEAHAFAAEQLPPDRRWLGMNLCSSHALRNWPAERQAALIRHAVERHGMAAVLLGGRSALERAYADAITRALSFPVLDLVGKDTLKQLLALLQRLSVLVSPDSGPMHLASAVGTPVIGLHAASNPKRSGAWNSQAWAVDRYDDAARTYRGKPAAELPWGSKIEAAGVMELVTVAEVCEMLDRFVAAGLGDEQYAQCERES